MKDSDEVEHLCFGCLLEGTIQAASTTRLGCAVCQRHANEGDSGPATKQTFCEECEMAGKAHWAWTVRMNKPVCIFHAIDNTFPNDDMREHDLYERIYEELRRAGYKDAY